jgi:hypothetical protein
VPGTSEFCPLCSSCATPSTSVLDPYPYGKLCLALQSFALCVPACATPSTSVLDTYPLCLGPQPWLHSSLFISHNGSSQFVWPSGCVGLVLTLALSPEITLQLSAGSCTAVSGRCFCSHSSYSSSCSHSALQSLHSAFPSGENFRRI